MSAGRSQKTAGVRVDEWQDPTQPTRADGLVEDVLRNRSESVGPVQDATGRVEQVTQVTVHRDSLASRCSGLSNRGCGYYGALPHACGRVSVGCSNSNRRRSMRCALALRKRALSSAVYAEPRPSPARAPPEPRPSPAVGRATHRRRSIRGASSHEKRSYRAPSIKRHRPTAGRYGCRRGIRRVAVALTDRGGVPAVRPLPPAAAELLEALTPRPASPRTCVPCTTSPTASPSSSRI